jgi:hypothetical protein
VSSTTHRLQPFDTHFNGPLKQLWRKELQQFFRVNEKVSLTRYDFGRVFTPVWRAATGNRGLLVNAFKHCGIFPVQNPTTEKDFQLSQSFENNHQTSDDVDNSSLLRQIAPSPKKASNSTHKRPHVALATTSDFVEGKRLRQRKPCDSSKPGSSSLPTSSSKKSTLTKVSNYINNIFE